jgi:hypothetical protein
MEERFALEHKRFLEEHNPSVLRGQSDADKLRKNLEPSDYKQRRAGPDLPQVHFQCLRSQAGGVARGGPGRR